LEINNPVNRRKNPEDQKHQWYYRQNYMFWWKRREKDMTYSTYPQN